jgi:drug/metabolite transporter (DMT)-like permease
LRQELKADLALLSVTLVWGTSFPIMSIALKQTGPYTFLAYRYLAAALILFFFVFKKLKTIDRRTLKAGLFIGFPLFVGCILQIVGLVYTTPSKSGFLTGMNVIFVPFFLALVYKQMPDSKSVAGVIFSVLGLSVMSLDSNMSMNFGDLLTLISAVAFAVQIILVDKYARDVDIAVISFLQMLLIGVLSFIPAVAFEGLKFPINRFSVSSIIFTAIFCSIYAYYVQNKMQPYTKPTHAAIIFLMEPVFSAIFSSFIGDTLTGKTLMGCLLILFGMIAINIKLPRKVVEQGIFAKDVDINS